MSGEMKRTLGDLMADETEGFVNCGGELRVAMGLGQGSGGNQTNDAYSYRSNGPPNYRRRTNVFRRDEKNLVVSIENREFQLAKTCLRYWCKNPSLGRVNERQGETHPKPSDQRVYALHHLLLHDSEIGCRTDLDAAILCS